MTASVGARFAGKTVVFTGGTSGIGLATARSLLREGAQVIVTYSREASCTRAKLELSGREFILNDVSHPGRAAAGLASAIGDRQTCGLMLNAGQATFAPLGQITAQEFERQFAILVKAWLLQVQALAPCLRDGASVVFTTSTARRMGAHGTAIYGAAKGAARSLVRVLARELAPRRITLTGLSPGPIDTGFAERTGMHARHRRAFATRSRPRYHSAAWALPTRPRRSLNSSGEASFVTGSEYVVDGGVTEL